MINGDVDSNNTRQTSNHNNFTKEFWLCACKLKMDLQQKCRDQEAQFVDNETKNHLDQKLANKTGGIPTTSLPTLVHETRKV